MTEDTSRLKQFKKEGMAFSITCGNRQKAVHFQSSGSSPSAFASPGGTLAAMGLPLAALSGETAGRVACQSRLFGRGRGCRHVARASWGDPHPEPGEFVWRSRSR